MKKSKRRKYGVWLHNKTDSRDDEWMYVNASSAKQAKNIAEEEYESHRFTLGVAMPVIKFRKYFGLSRGM